MKMKFFKKSEEFFGNNTYDENVASNPYGFKDTEFIQDLQSQVATDKDMAIFERYI